MSTLPPIRRLLVEDFPTQKNWISPLLIIFNSFTEAVVNVLNKGITIIDNTTSDILTVTLSNIPTPNTDGGSVGPTPISWSKAAPPVAVIIGDVAQISGSSHVARVFTLANAVQVQWQMDSTGKVLLITGVAGIAPTQATQYTLTLLCIQG